MSEQQIDKLKAYLQSIISTARDIDDAIDADDWDRASEGCSDIEDEIKKVADAIEEQIV